MLLIVLPSSVILLREPMIWLVHWVLGSLSTTFVIVRQPAKSGSSSHSRKWSELGSSVHALDRSASLLTRITAAAASCAASEGKGGRNTA
ncbi:hypothetical protein B0J11DRAFT_543687 [Dendryphion nanum]|uniref:Uncharacterized protein n=1 Tax=Dendryphion nanum TaxID=256645 RepID=A0A9P9D287_9PLEO|nr:hypothetical protein B0J11DRAFT_543687 [Dendryphion nanum]